jgi:hypothetical protein
MVSQTAVYSRAGDGLRQNGAGAHSCTAWGMCLGRRRREQGSKQNGDGAI